MSYEPSLVMETSPYLAPLREIRFSGKNLCIGWDVVRMCEILHFRLSKNQYFSTAVGRWAYRMDDVTSDVGHVLLHYLATGRYRYRKVGGMEKIPYFKTAMSLAVLAKDLELEYLVSLALREVMVMAPHMSADELLSHMDGQVNFINSFPEIYERIHNRIHKDTWVPCQFNRGENDTTGSTEKSLMIQSQGSESKATQKKSELHAKKTTSSLRPYESPRHQYLDEDERQEYNELAGLRESGVLHEPQNWPRLLRYHYLGGCTDQSHQIPVQEGPINKPVKAVLQQVSYLQDPLLWNVLRNIEKASKKTIPNNVPRTDAEISGPINKGNKPTIHAPTHQIRQASQSNPPSSKNARPVQMPAASQNPFIRMGPPKFTAFGRIASTEAPQTTTQKIDCLWYPIS
ncbi:hypothetical protein F53441_7142 [Fusarium austroafricanum]|uniref:Uncharacterized protein n=1 Tax=Fusarium austroafricanum TaxID=2364996 RepID=A0A8H4KE27_9HYPO|nr:hypothetical protein F53441_7142 [Fusarium austroafricanum]